MTRLTIVHERFTEFAGSEQVVAQLARQWPDAPVVAPISRPRGFPPEFQARITSTPLSRLVRAGGGYEALLPLLPLAMRHLRLGQPDVVLASHHAFASQVVHATAAPVVAYVHSPARWVWDPAMRQGEAGGRAGAVALSGFAAAFRPADRRAAARLRAIVANSSAVAERIQNWWHQPATVVHPPIDTEHFVADPTVTREDFLLLAGRLVPYKQPGVAISAARRAGRRLVVAGDGRLRAECESLAGPETTFLGRVSDEELRSLYRRCAALIMPGVEDFGIIPVEAQACGTPVLATGVGGALDSVLPGITGELVPWEDDLTHAWTAALRTFDPAQYDPVAIRTHAEQFSRAHFDARMRDVLNRATT